MILDHDWIVRHIAHQGRMCLLDTVEAWDPQRIICRAGSHRAGDNPLRADGRLGAACGIEYAAQAMAVHGVLQAGSQDRGARIGYLISIRGASLRVARLDDIAGDLLVEANCISSNDEHVLYRFSVKAEDRLLLDGRAAIVTDAGTRTTDTERKI